MGKTVKSTRQIRSRRKKKGGGVCKDAAVTGELVFGLLHSKILSPLKPSERSS